MKVKEKSEKAGLKLNFQKTKIVASGPITSWQIDEETNGKVMDFIFLGSKITVNCDYSHEIKRCLLLGSKAVTNLEQRHHFADKGPYSQSYSFPNSHVPVWELDHKEGWSPKNWCVQTLLLEKTLDSPLDRKEIKPNNPKVFQSWIFIGRADAEAWVVWTPDGKRWLIGRDPDTGKDWGQEEKWVTEDEMIGWHHWLNGHELEQTLGDSEGQGSLVSCSPWARKESNTMEQLNNNQINPHFSLAVYKLRDLHGLFRFRNLLEYLPELKKAVYLWLPFYYRGSRWIAKWGDT